MAPVDRADRIVRMISARKDVLPVDTFGRVQTKYLIYAEMDGLYQYWVAIMMDGGERDHVFPPLPPLEQVKREMLFRYYSREERVVGHMMTFRDSADDEDFAIAHGIKKYFYPRRTVGLHVLPPRGFHYLVGARRTAYTGSHKICLEWRLDETTFVQSGEWHFFPRLLISSYSPSTGVVQRMNNRPTPDRVQKLVKTILLTPPM